VMTTFLVRATPEERVDQVRLRLRDEREHGCDVDSVVLVDELGRLIDDVSLFDLAVADSTATMAELAGDEPPITLPPTAELNQVAERLIASRRSSVLVCEGDRVLGRILADDVVDALIPERGRLHFPRLLQ
jgi:Mg/Co/Ni transporter MgtE